LVIVKVNVETPPARMGFEAKSLEMLGGRTAVNAAEATPVGPVFVPLSVAETNPLTLTCGPAVVAVTVTGMSQKPPPASVPPENEIVLGAVVVNVPPHWDEEPLATVSPEGNVSVNATPLKAEPAFGLTTVKVNVDVPPTATGSGEKLFVIVGGSGLRQPVKMTLSRQNKAPGFLPEPSQPNRNVVVFVPVVAAKATRPAVKAPLGAVGYGEYTVKAPPFALVFT
jgi:hypothetical protein